MAISEMPCDAHQMMWIGTANLNERFRRSNHFDQLPVFQHQRIAAAQRQRFLKIEQKF